MEMKALFKCTRSTAWRINRGLDRSIVKEICRKEGVSPYRLSQAIGVHNVVLGNWRMGRRKPSKAAFILLKLIERHGLNALFSGELSQPVEPQQKDSLKIT